jgi:cytochrome c peroxidase
MSLFDETFLNKSYYAQISDVDLLDPDKIALGKILFYDPVLSRSVNMSCATCHNPEKGFSDGRIKSMTTIPVKGLLRNTPTLVNSVFSEKYFLDMREYDLERQVKHVVYNKHEFNMDFVELADRLKQSEEYVQLFTSAYGDRDKYVISTWSISNALAAYVASLSKFDSPFDRYMRGETDELSPEVIFGYNLFMGKAGCGTCHFAPTFNGTVPPLYRETESEVLGIPAVWDTIAYEIDPDIGRARNGRMVDALDQFAYSFKTTTVRNSALTGPYMHNGTFESLEKVVEFYNKGGGRGIGIDIPNQTLPESELQLSENEKLAIVAFMNALTDTVGMTSTIHHLPHFDDEQFNSRKVNY